MIVNNTLSKKLEEFKTINDGVVTMYVCGPTVYNYIHIGNARPVVFFDMVRRYFESIGYEVKYITNVTDVNDKIYKKSLELGLDEFEYANQMTEAFLEDVKNLNCKEFYKVTKVTEYMGAIIDFVQLLLDKGYAYQTKNKDVYFRIDKARDYGHLSGQKVEDLISGSRVEVISEKENPLDFVLWKHETIGHIFDAPFGSGRPGWHTECVCMIQKEFGGMIDIHGGGTDLRFPHHENERAQSILGYGHPLAKYWIHNARLDLNSEKMSKSVGNFITVKDILKTKESNVIRLLLLSSNYSLIINYTVALIENVTKENDKIMRAYKQAFLMLDLKNAFSKKNNEARIAEFNACMEDNFNTSNAMTCILNSVKEINKLTRSKNLTLLPEEFNSLNYMINIFGLEYECRKMTDEEKDLYNLWVEARKNKDFDKADEYRNLLNEKGLI